MSQQFPTSSKRKNLRSFILTQSDDFVLIQSTENKLTTQLVFEKKSLKIVETQNSKKFIFKEKTTSQHISLMIGIIKILDSHYLIYAPEVYYSGTYLDNQIYQIANVNMILLNSSKQSQEDKIQVQNIKQQIKNNFLYGFFFSFTCNLTLSFKKMVNLSSSNQIFDWSQHFLTLFQKVSNQWKIPIIQGYFGSFQCSLKGESTYYYLISRRCKYMSGIRTYYRGIADQGYCANFVQTQQIIKTNNKIISHLFLRGSVPIFWQQKSDSAPIRFTRNKQLTKIAFINHFNIINKNYGRVLCINLLDKQKQQNNLIKGYEQIFSQCFELFWQILRYQYFNFNQAQKSHDVNMFIQKNSKVTQTFCYDEFDSKTGKFICQQNGIYRINCLDCLGRSSQFMIKMAFNTINIILKQLDISLENTVFFKDIYQQIDSDIKKCHEFTRLFNCIWAQNKDFLSKLYCGLQSTCSNLTSLGFKSFFDQISIGSFKSQSNQIKLKALDAIVGQHIHTDNQNDKLQTSQPLNIFIATWNVNDINPNKIDFSHFSSKMQNPDMIVFAVQEMVELSPNNILNESNAKTNQWKKVLDVEIQKLPTTFIFIDKIQLVGMWMIVYIANKWKTRIKGVFKQKVKTGMGGKYGNKGGVIIRIKIDQTTINLINAHLEAGESGLQDRIQNIKDIHQKAFNQNLKGVKNQERIQNCDYKFLIGDLNFRINMPVDQVKLILQERKHFKQVNDTRASQKLLSELVKNDQLTISRQTSQTNSYLNAYAQYPITFDPTYKMQLFQAQYSHEKNRIPSWCDRILIWTDKSYNQRFYQSIPNMFGSDHRPVIAQFTLFIQKTPADKKQQMTENEAKQFRDSQFQFSI